MTNPMKPRSHEVTDGYERAPARAMLRAVGMTDDDWDKPQVAVCSSWNEVTPCNMPLEPAGQAGQGGRARRGRLPDRVHDHRGERRHLDGPRGDAGVAGESRGHRRLGRDGDARRAVRRPGHLRRLRQVVARHAHGLGPAQRAVGVRLRRLDPARQLQRQGARHRVGVRGGRVHAAPARSPKTSSTRSSATRARPKEVARACSPPTRWRRWPRRSACRCPAQRRRRRSTAAATTSPTRAAKPSSSSCGSASAPARS